MNPGLKKVRFWFQHVDGIWSVPLAFTLFWLLGVGLQSMFGYQVGTYDLSFIQPLFLSIAIVSGANTAALFFIRFTFRGFYEWFFGKKNELGKYLRGADEDWKNIASWQKFKVFLFVFFFYVAAIIAVYRMLV